jgi:uncharacterized protein DUF2721
MQDGTGIASVAHAIQLAVAPVFLLSGVAALLAVLTNRLSRVIDRSRTLHEHPASSPEQSAAVQDELRALSRRAQLISHAITYCTVTALLVCAVIAALFVGAFIRFPTAVLVALLFVAAMVALFIGLLSFLREILIASANLRIEPR